jgi:hypothetical protein
LLVPSAEASMSRKASSLQLTEHYQAGHGDEAVVYMKVKADLKV